MATYAISTPLNRTLADQEVAEFERLNSTIIGEEQNNSIVDSFESDFAPAESHQLQTEKASVLTISPFLKVGQKYSKFGFHPRKGHKNCTRIIQCNEHQRSG